MPDVLILLALAAIGVIVAIANRKKPDTTQPARHPAQPAKAPPRFQQGGGQTARRAKASQPGRKQPRTGGGPPRKPANQPGRKPAGKAPAKDPGCDDYVAVVGFAGRCLGGC